MGSLAARLFFPDYSGLSLSVVGIRRWYRPYRCEERAHQVGRRTFGKRSTANSSRSTGSTILACGRFVASGVRLLLSVEILGLEVTASWRSKRRSVYCLQNLYYGTRSTVCLQLHFTEMDENKARAETVGGRDASDSMRLVQDQLAVAQDVLWMCGNDWKQPPRLREFRIYKSTMRITWTSAHQMHRTIKRMKYEIGCRYDEYQANKDKRNPSWLKNIVTRSDRAETLVREPIDTPADYVERMLKLEPKHTSRAPWTKFNFDGVVYALATWLSCLTWHPEAKLDDLLDTREINLSGISTLDHISATAAPVVTVSQTVDDSPCNSTYWVMVAAASAAGAAVVSDRVALDAGGNPKFVVRGGLYLADDILNALGILAELYHRADAGANFAYALFKGLHTVSTVVAHSDEGGFIRDVLREGKFGIPFGGLPYMCARSNSFPTLRKEASYSSLVNIVDSLLLKSAACVGHCAPLIETNGGPRAFVARGWCPEVVRDQKDIVDKTRQFKEGTPELAAAKKRHFNLIATALRQGISQFAPVFAKGLASLLGLSSGGRPSRAITDWMMDQCDVVLQSADSRHLLKNDIIAPFFWIEPTTILGRNQLGTPAEEAGLASLGGKDDGRSCRMFDGIAKVDRPTFSVGSYALPFSGARTCPWIWALQGNAYDGLGCISFKRLEPQDLALAGGRAATVGVDAAFDEGLNIAGYLWVRGQSALPHPAELSHMHDSVVISVVHRDEADDEIRITIPPPDEIEKTELSLSFQVPTGASYGSQNTEARQERFERTVATQTLNRMASVARSAAWMQLCDDGRVRGRVTLPRSSGGRVNLLVREEAHEGTVAETISVAKPSADRLPMVAAQAKGQKLQPAYVHQPHSAPRPPQPSQVAGDAAASAAVSSIPQPGPASDGGAAEGSAPQAP